MGGVSSHAEEHSQRPGAQRKAGLLFKESETVKAWNPRYCILDSRVLSYWDSKTLCDSGELPRAVISLENCQVSLVTEDAAHPDALLIETPTDARRLAAQRGQTRLFFQAETLQELVLWAAVLQLASREPWLPGAGVSRCPLCRLADFDPLRRKHHCRFVARIPANVCILHAPVHIHIHIYTYIYIPVQEVRHSRVRRLLCR